ncbi:DUF4157 domain-containing protein [Gracilimonas mengyeensis]|uniref:eCIS core domain-containing protein n=1 Tax=Gracilimonas mengyeensis TaxID=1302730 RepID=A0A521FEQ5_9BACT|nr:DUF4157 domain-containing protein [Gracilimonas mengyeensis]SMO94686.1 protein of unknown function [Gracilimonas mengyeensis]
MNSYAEKNSEKKQDSAVQSKNRYPQRHCFEDKRPEHLIQMKMAGMANSKGIEEAHERFSSSENDTGSLQSKALTDKENKTGLPDDLKSGIESMSGHSLDDVRVNYNSSKPAQLNAHAFAQRNEIHLGPGQEKHLPHEAWHVVQQKQGRVKPTYQLKKGVAVNDDSGLEAEADKMAEVLGGTTLKTRTWSGSDEISQLKETANKHSLIEIEQPEMKGEVAQLMAIANVVVFNDGGGAKVVNIKFAERVPTTVSGGQGDHGVAEVLIQESISSLKGKTIYGFLEGLYHMVMSDLEGIEIARHTSQLDEVSGINKANLLHEIATLAGNLDKTPPENLQYLLSEVTTKYWRLLEKREMTAFKKEDKLTTGGGQEKDGIKGLRRIKERLHSTMGSDIDYQEENALADAIGYTPFLMDLIAQEFSNEDLDTLVSRAATHVAEFLGISDGGFISELTNQLGYSFQLLIGKEKDGYFGLVSEGNVTDSREASEVREFATWHDASYTRLFQGELIRITAHQPNISERVFRVTEEYDPSRYQYIPETPPVEWINQ